MTRPRIPICVYQHRYWQKWAQNPNGSFFNMSLAFELVGNVDKAAFRQACDFVTRKHDIMHARFSADGTEQHYGGFTIDDFFTDRGSGDAAGFEEELFEILNRPFDLETGPAVDFCLVQRGGRQYFIGRAHHTIADAVAAKIFVTDLAIAYATYRQVPSGPPLNPYSYADCVDAVHAPHTPARLQAAREFWTSFLDDTPRTIAFPTRPDAVEEDHAAESIPFELDPAATEGLRQFCQRNGTTLFLVLLGIYGAALASYADQEVIVISYPINMRPKGHEHVFGCFVNLSLLKVTVTPSTTFASMIAAVTQQREEARPHLFYQLSQIIHERGQVRADIEKSYFSVFFGESYLNKVSVPLGDMTLQTLDVPWSQFDRDLRLLYDTQDPARIKLRMDFRRTKHDRATVERFVADLEQLATRLVADDRPLRQILDEVRASSR